MLSDVANLLMQIQDDIRILPFVGMSVTGDLFLAFDYLPLGSLEKFLELNRLVISLLQIKKISNIEDLKLLKEIAIIPDNAVELNIFIWHRLSTKLKIGSKKHQNYDENN